MSGINLQELRAQRAMERKMNVEKDLGGIIHSGYRVPSMSANDGNLQEGVMVDGGLLRVSSTPTKNESGRDDFFTSPSLKDKTPLDFSLKLKGSEKEVTWDPNVSQFRSKGKFAKAPENQSGGSSELWECMKSSINGIQAQISSLVEQREHDMQQAQLIAQKAATDAAQDAARLATQESARITQDAARLAAEQAADLVSQRLDAVLAANSKKTTQQETLDPKEKGRSGAEKTKPAGIPIKEHGSESFILHQEEIVDLKCFELTKLVYMPGNHTANMDAWNIWKAKGKKIWASCAEGGDRVWLRHEVAAEEAAEQYFSLTVAERSNVRCQQLDVELTRIEKIIHNKLLAKTVLQLPDRIFADVERFARRTGDYNLADMMFFIMKRFGISNTRARQDVLGKLIPTECKNEKLHAELQQIQDRVEEYFESGLLLESHDFSKYFLALQNLLKGRKALENRIDNWESKRKIPMIIYKDFFSEFLDFAVVLAEEKYGISEQPEQE